MTLLNIRMQDVGSLKIFNKTFIDYQKMIEKDFKIKPEVLKTTLSNFYYAFFEIESISLMKRKTDIDL